MFVNGLVCKIFICFSLYRSFGPVRYLKQQIRPCCQETKIRINPEIRKGFPNNSKTERTYAAGHYKNFIFSNKKIVG